MSLATWLHHLMNPHCPDCQHDKVCQSCETLREQLAFERDEKKKLLDSILEASKPKDDKTVADPSTYKPVKPTFVPWNVRRQMLEAEDREKARILRNQSEEEKKIAELEKAIGIEISLKSGEANANQ